jgi:signal peptidase
MINRPAMILYRQSHKYSLVLLAGLLTAFLLDNLVYGPRWGGFTGNYLLPSLTWALLILYLLRIPRVRPAAKLRHKTPLNWLAVLCAIIGILAILLQGGMAGFGNSPYDRRLMGIAINLVSLGAVLIATEMSRAWLMNRYFRLRPLTGIPLLASFFTILAIPLTKLSTLQGTEAITKFIGTNLFPDLSQNLLLTYLAYLGGAFPAIVYKGLLVAVEYLSPILPNEGLIPQTLLGTLAPILGLLLVYQLYNEDIAKITRRINEGESLWGWAFTGVAAILILWFSMGVFAYAPRVIVSASMQPTMNIGDVVIIKRATGDEVQVGDVIMFPLNNMKVTHRIVDETVEEGKKKYITKGDGNLERDTDPVPAQAVQGKVVTVIPKAGLLTIQVRNFT